MGNIQDSSFIGIYRILKDFLGGDIKVVCRLIQDQEVGFGKHELSQGNAASFSTT